MDCTSSNFLSLINSNNWHVNAGFSMCTAFSSAIMRVMLLPFTLQVNISNCDLQTQRENFLSFIIEVWSLLQVWFFVFVNKYPILGKEIFLVLLIWFEICFITNAFLDFIVIFSEFLRYMYFFSFNLSLHYQF